MNNFEYQKQCPRCHKNFICNKDNVLICQCNQIELNKNEKAYIASQFNDCLCLDCLKELKKEFLEKSSN